MFPAMSWNEKSGFFQQILHTHTCSRKKRNFLMEQSKYISILKQIMAIFEIQLYYKITNILLHQEMLSNNSSHTKNNRSSSQGKQPRTSKGSHKKLNLSGKENIPFASQKATFPQKPPVHKAQYKTTEDKITQDTRSINAVPQNNLDNASLQDMIELLKQYEKVCLEKQDFSSAEQAKNKIDFLKTQQLMLRKEQLENQEKQTIERISKEGEEQIKMFQEHWDEQLQQLIQALKEVQSNLTEQHERQLEEIQEKLATEQPPRVKFSSKILQIRKHLSNLIKVKNYKQAEMAKQNLQAREREQIQKWNEKFELKKQHKMQTIIKKQENQLKALRIRLEGVFNEKLKERDQKFQILLKKNRKRRIQSGKISRERLKTKTALMNESKSYMQSTIGVIGNSTYKF